MNDLINKIKNLVGKKQPSLSDLYNYMEEELKNAEEAIGGDFFPKEKVLSPEQVHYLNLKLSKNANFDDVKNNYQKLKEKYNLEKFEVGSDKYKKAIELNARIDFSFSYFKQKFGIK